jgi:hypothetical protein
MKPVYIYKFEASTNTKYFILDNQNFEYPVDQFNYLTQLDNNDQIFINREVNQYYSLSTNVANYYSIGTCAHSGDYTKAGLYVDAKFFTLIDFNDLLNLLDRIVKEKYDNSWKGTFRLVELLQLIIANWDNWN